MKNQFNLIEEPWIPVADNHRVSLRQIFSNPNYRELGGHPIEKIAILKLLLAIAQAAYTPKDEIEWRAIQETGLMEVCLNYLEQWQDRFYLYGDKPFLQMPAIAQAELKTYGTLMPNIASGNTAFFSQCQQERPLDDGQKALLLLTQMSLALGGKKTDNKVTLTLGYQGKINNKGKPTTGKPGPGIGYLGYLHSFALNGNIQRTLWMNLLTQQNLNEALVYPGGVGRPPWEQMPQGEDCPVAQALKSSLIGRLIPLSRFCLLSEKGVHLSEGLQHLGAKEGVFDPSITIKKMANETKVLWANVDKRPWRELQSLVGFICERYGTGSCLQLKCALLRCNQQPFSFGVWSGGLQVGSNAGEQYTSGKKDAIESTLRFPPYSLNETWLANYAKQMDKLDKMCKVLFHSIMSYFGAMKMDGKKIADHGCFVFWHLCERQALRMISCCSDNQGMNTLSEKFSENQIQAYSHCCTNQTPKQITLWVKYHPQMKGNPRQKIT